jgi:phage tail-like protein
MSADPPALVSPRNAVTGPREVFMATFREDPYTEFNFQISIEGLAGDGPQAGFSEVSGLGVTIETIEYRTGNEPESTVRKLPGLKKFSDVTLKRGVVGDLSFWEWIRTAMDGQVERRTVQIRLLDEAREPVLAWRLRRAWPCRYEGPGLRAGNSDVALETLVICHEGLELE